MQEGDKIRDYILEEKIGEGGMGEVWRARHAILDRRVAIKAMARHLESDPEFGRRFLQEAQSQARLSHPRIVGVSDFFAEGGQYFLVMPLLSGESLADRLHEIQAPLPVSDALIIARDVLEALDYAHQQGVIHRDVKPSNILLDREGHASLTDFGIALSLGRQRVTHTTASLGTPHYMSPEQIRSPRSVDHRTDVYSFGCVLYEMLTGHPPFADAADAEDTDFALKEAHVYRVPESLRKRNPHVPAWLDAVVLRALAKNPDERFSGCGEFRRTLDAPPEAASAAASPADSPAAVPVRAPSGERRQNQPIVRKEGPAPVQTRRAPVALIAVIALAVAALAAIVFATRDRWGSPGTTTDGLVTDFTTAEPVSTTPDVEIIEPRDDETSELTSQGPEEVTDQGTEEPMGTDMVPAEPKKKEEENKKNEESKENEANKGKKEKKDKKTKEPLTTDTEINVGVMPIDTDLGTVEPLGTDMRPPH